MNSQNTQFGGVLDVMLDVAKDPALPALVKRIGVLKKILLDDAAAAPKPVGPQPPKPPVPPGVGLDSVVAIIDKYLWFRQNLWVVGVAAGVTIFVPGLLGFGLGVASARKSAVKPALSGGHRRRRRR